ncbi:ribonuclease J [Geobacter sp. SVR]|uniref:ribonuclease J n=1 Tax=Geobacter sp. SVR TaxID=2495594 RepID=UPI00143F022F|nr:ribonuclease J [Geobacter sp. SVR]BCS55911.1 ribonuclease J [Geobacter sp. SVR]GCF84674.1 ribonuclease J [Geobacter sp. SVR]
MTESTATAALNIIPLGGLGEIGMNIMAYECGDDIVIVDCGLMFPEPDMLGIDYVIPDITWLRERSDKVRAICLTHGHEDHIGALPFVLQELNVPVYGSALTLGFVNEKLREYKLDGAVELVTVRPRETVELGCFRVEFLRVAHSIVDGCALAITTPEGVVIHTGDFKIDHTPVDGQLTDLARLSRYGEEGVLALLSDSTNVEREGFTLSEKYVGEALAEIFPKCRGRVIVAAFSSSIHRVQQVADVAIRNGRRILLNGRSMVANVRIARELGYLTIPDEALMDLRELEHLPPEQVCIISTGSQGEPMSSLIRIAMDDHKQIKLAKGDTVILSSRVIPGNERTISELINHLYRRGAEVYHERVSEVHVSGHASQEELKLMLNTVQPRFFIPIHGEYRHLIKHIQLAQRVGIPEERCLLATNGDVVSFYAETAAIVEKVESGRVFVDGKGIGDVGAIVLKDRKHLSEDGMVVVIIGINQTSGAIIHGPDIVSRGFVFEDESRDYLEEARAVVTASLDELNEEMRCDCEEVKQAVRQALRRFFKKTIERRPVILPVIMEM